MIAVNSTPCIECKFYDGVKNKGSERTEYIACKKSPTKSAFHFLVMEKRTIKCAKFEQEE